LIVRLLIAAAVLFSTVAQTGAQQQLRCAFADAAQSTPLALQWLRDEWLPALDAWPADRNPQQAFSLRVSRPRADSTRLVVDDAVVLPSGTAYCGEWQMAPGLTIAFAGDEAGTERWQVHGRTVPAAVHELLVALNLDADGAPRRLDPLALLAHLSGPVVHGDPTADLLSMAAARCGEVTLSARHTADGIEVLGRSEGGLLLPALLVHQAMQRPAAVSPVDPDLRLALRAFTSRDGDRSEAARQLQRHGSAGLTALRAMLHADEPTRTAAIDSLVRLGAAGELPEILGAADESMPMACAMAEHALRELWPLASLRTRESCWHVLEQSDAIDASSLADQAHPRDPRAARLGLLSVLATGLFSLLLRERRRLHG
jgi:hypothetical protein